MISAGWRNAGLLLPFIAVIIIVLRLTALVDGRDPGFDQSSLLANFPLPAGGSYFKPLPYFEQATPLGHLFILDSFSRIFDNQRIFMVRALTVLASFGAVWCFWQALKRFLSVPELALAAVLATYSAGNAYITANVKHYAFEYLGVCLMLWLSVRLADEFNRKNAALFFAGGVYLALFTFVAPIVLAFCGVGLAVYFYFEKKQTIPQLAPLAALGVVTALPILLAYFLYSKPVTAYQFAAFGFRYERTHFSLLDPFSKHNLFVGAQALRMVYDLMEPPFGDIGSKIIPGFKTAMSIIFVALMGFGLSVLFKRSLLLASVTTAAFGVYFALNTAGLVPINGFRHWFFLLPLFALLITLAVSWMLDFASKRIVKFDAISARFLAGLAIMLGLFSIPQAATLEEQEISPLLKRIKDDPAPLWAYYGAQPGMRAVAPDFPDVFGWVPHESREDSWLNGPRQPSLSYTNEDYYAETQRALRGHDRVYMIFVHHFQEWRGQGIARFEKMAEAEIGPCTRFTDEGSILLDCRRKPDRD